MVTQIADVIVPEVFNKYVIQRTAELSAIRASGILASLPGLTVPSGGTTVKMPFWNDINGDDEVFTDSGETTPDKLTADKDIAVILTRIKSWSAHDLSGMFAGDDPLRAAGELVASFWARKEQKTLLSILAGALASTSMSSHTLDDSANAVDKSMLIDAMSLLGDAGSELSGMIMHSAVMYDLAKKRILDEKPTEPGTNVTPEFQTFLGRRVITDDSAPKTGSGAATVYTTYLFGPGAIAYAEGNPVHPVELERQGTKSVDVLIHRREFIMHPRGVRWIGTAAAATPSNTELATGTKWERVYNDKNIHIIALKHKIGE